LALVVALLLLMPSFFVFTVSAAGGASSQVATAPAEVPAAAKPSPLSSYKSIGAADPNMPVLVSVVIPLRNLQMLTSLVKQYSDPNSGNFRHFLNYSEASRMFLPTQGQYQSVVDYLTAKGFTIDFSALNSMIVVHGTAAQVSQDLGQKVEIFTNGTYSYYETTGASSLSGAYSYGSNSSGLLMRPDFMKAASAASGAIPSGNVTFTEGGQSTKLLQTVYNSTGLLSNGLNGKGYTVGLLDFYGYPLVAQDLAAYDKTYRFPAPPSFNVSAIGPYNPNLGASLGWAEEINLDVQVSHAMAPGANIVLYAANGALSLASAVAGVVQDGRANVVSQSFGLPEWEYYEAGPLPYLFNAVFTDDYYMLGSAMGMTFLSSSGDAGGSGYSAGPMGGAEYPSSSPYVTALGGTATYVSATAGGAPSFNQTAWSNIGFVPYFVNEGGSGGGVSILEPTPWYQSSLNAPASFPAGRLVPDLSLDGSGNPGTFIIYQGSPMATGGTSESSPLFAGLLTLVMDEEKGNLGLINPTIYQMATDPATYQAAFTPITFGYTIPWVSAFGYNLATGWGSPNIGEIAALYRTVSSHASTLNVNVGIANSGKDNFTDFVPGDSMSVLASVSTPFGAPVTAGAFTASLQTLKGATSSVTLTFNASLNGWAGTIPVGNQSGIAYVDVSGNNGAGQSGEGFASTFVGYLSNFIQPLAPYPWTFQGGLETAISITDLFGNAPPFTTMRVAFESYSIITNTYSPDGSGVLNFSNGTGYYLGTLTENLTSGPVALVTQGAAAGYLPFVSGISLLGTAIYPQVVAEPGSVAPGQSLTIVATLTAPENIYFVQSLSTGVSLGQAIAEGANVTATLVTPSGLKVATVPLAEQTCAEALRVCGAGLTLINGYLTIPADSTPGLYTVLLDAGYNDETTGHTYTGSYFGQIYVAGGSASPKISVSPSTLFEGQNATIAASITYPGGKEVTEGVYTALIYPKTYQAGYSSLMHSTYSAFSLIPLAFDAKTNVWVGNATMPSPYNSSILSLVNANAEYYGGPYDVYVSGVSADGMPTNSSLSAQQDFFVQPYVYTADRVVTGLQQTSRLALSNVTINAGSSPLLLSNDYFFGSNTVTGSEVTISSSVLNGVLNLGSGTTTLDGVVGGDVFVTNAKIVVQHSSLSSLHLGAGATASIDTSSTYKSITPALPVLTFSSPVANASYAGNVNAQLAISGSGITSITFMLDGRQLPLTGGAPPGPEVSYPIDTTSMSDGTHTLTAVAIQSDLLTSSASVSFVTHSQLQAVTNDLAAANETIGSLNGSLNAANGNIASLQGDLNSANQTIGNLTNLVYLALAIAAVAVVLGVYAIRGELGPTETPLKY
jgi:subtilase family serine protease